MPEGFEELVGELAIFKFLLGKLDMSGRRLVWFVLLVLGKGVAVIVAVVSLA